MRFVRLKDMPLERIPARKTQKAARTLATYGSEARQAMPALVDLLQDCPAPEVFDVIENRPERLLELPGIGHKRREAVSLAWAKRAMPSA